MVISIYRLCKKSSKIVTFCLPLAFQSKISCKILDLISLFNKSCQNANSFFSKCRGSRILNFTLNENSKYFWNYERASNKTSHIEMNRVVSTRHPTNGEQNIILHSSIEYCYTGDSNDIFGRFMVIKILHFCNNQWKYQQYITFFCHIIIMVSA